MAGLPFVSKRFALKRFVGMTDEDLAENERMWKEENGEGKPTPDSAGELRTAGVSPTSIEQDAAMSAGTEEAPADMAAPDDAAAGAAPTTPTDSQAV
jgi:hypothetical protein